MLITRFFTDSAVGEVVDFMPVAGEAATDTHRLVRMVRCVRGRMRFAVDVAPRFDYGRQAHVTELLDAGGVFRSDTLTLTLHVVRQPDDAHLAQARIEDGGVRVSLELEAGQLRGMVLESAADGPPREVGVAEISRLFDDTVRFWHDWLARSTYVGRWRERKRSWSTGRGTGARGRCGSATARPISSSSTSTAKRWTASSPPTARGSSCRTAAGRPSPTCSTGSPRTGTSPRKASGKPGADASPSPTGG